MTFNPGGISQRDRLAFKSLKDSIRPRGPDEQRALSYERFLMAHSRLAILGNKTVGRQPAVSDSGRFLLAFNGEIYNFRALAAEHKIKDVGSDTQILFSMLQQYGPTYTVNKVEGMYAFVLIDLWESSAVFMVDRFGQKPLYYQKESNVVSICSELNGFSDHGCEVDVAAVDSFLRFGHVALPHSLNRKVKKAMPGRLYKVDETGALTEELIVKSPPKMLSITHDDWQTTVCRHLESDLPLCGFLSGGVDSALVLAAAAREQDVTAITFDYGTGSKSEVRQAQKIAKYLGMQHEVVSITGADWENTLRQLGAGFSEPIADPAALGLSIMIDEAKSLGFSVGLTGDGGDENFGGYNFIESKYRRWYGELSRIKIPTPVLRRKFPTRFGREMKRWLALRDSSVTSDLDLMHKHAFGDYHGYGVLDEDAFRKNNPDIFHNSDYREYNRTFLLASRFCPKLDRSSGAKGFELRAPFLADNLSGSVLTRADKLKLYEHYIPDRLRNYEKSGFAVDLKSILYSKAGSAWVVDGLDSFEQRCNFLTPKLPNFVRSFRARYITDITYEYRAAMLGNWLERNNAFIRGR